MKEMEFEDWLKFDLKIGKVLDKEIDLGKRKFKFDKKINAKKGDKIVVGVMKDKVVIPFVGGSVISPEKDIEIGSKIS